MSLTQASDNSRYRRILAIKLADLGDLLTVTPALQALHAAYPSASIDLLTPPSSAHLLGGAPYINNIVAFDKYAFDSLSGLFQPSRVFATLRLLLGLRLSKYDALAIFHHFTGRWGALKFAILSVASGAKTRAGLDNGRGQFLTLRTPDRGFGVMHEADYWLHVAALLGADIDRGWRPHLPITDTHRAFAANLLKEMGMNYAAKPVAIHAGAGAYSRARIWPTERFAEVARSLIKMHNIPIIIVGGPDEVEAATTLQRLVQGDAVHNLAGKTTIHETAALIERCSLFLGNDSGPMHIAAAVGTPVVAVFGPSNKEAWGPYTPPGEPSPHRIVARDLPCMPCFYRAHSLGLREGCGPRPCLSGLGADAVLKACEEALAANGARKTLDGGIP
jgi:lipopolysaccharide heptosyltransferase II